MFWDFVIVTCLHINTYTPSNILVSHNFIGKAGAEHCREHHSFPGKSENWTPELLNQKSVGFPLLLPSYSLLSLSLLPGAGAQPHPGYFPSILIHISIINHAIINISQPTFSPKHCFHCRWAFRGSTISTSHQSCQNSFSMPSTAQTLLSSALPQITALSGDLKSSCSSRKFCWPDRAIICISAAAAPVASPALCSGGCSPCTQ